jgi:hypothetical protein
VDGGSVQTITDHRIRIFVWKMDDIKYILDYGQLSIIFVKTKIIIDIYLCIKNLMKSGDSTGGKKFNHPFQRENYLDKQRKL